MRLGEVLALGSNRRAIFPGPSDVRNLCCRFIGQVSTYQKNNSEKYAQIFRALEIQKSKRAKTNNVLIRRRIRASKKKRNLKREGARDGGAFRGRKKNRKQKKGFGAMRIWCSMISFHVLAQLILLLSCYDPPCESKCGAEKALLEYFRPVGLFDSSQLNRIRH